MSKHRAKSSARPLFSGQLAAVGVVAVALGAGSTSGLAPVADRSDAPAPVVTYSLSSATTGTAPASGTTTAVAAAPASDLATDGLWYGLLSAAAVAGAVGARQFVAAPPRSARRA